MTKVQAAETLATLAPDSRRVVMDLIAILGKNGKKTKLTAKSKRLPLEREKFIGMWRNRHEMQDSTAWVRSLREKEWSR